MGLFEHPDGSVFQQIPVSDGLFFYAPEFLGKLDSEKYISLLRQEIEWKQEKIRIFGKSFLTPRLTAWIGDEGKVYCYSGLRLHPGPWTATLLELRTIIEQATNCSFNSVLLNLYRNEKDSMGWHADDEKELGVNPAIASLSLGSPRIFRLRNKFNHRKSFGITLANGSLLLMAGELQHHWQHCLPRSLKPMNERINLTFRKIVT